MFLAFVLGLGRSLPDGGRSDTRQLLRREHFDQAGGGIGSAAPVPTHELT
jgi:hypothetical protein